MTGYKHEDFAGLVGETFELEIADGSLELVLEKAEENEAGIREEGSFRLEFRGPYSPVLPQAIYKIDRGEESWVIFIVPIQQDDAGTSYEAVFN